MQIYMYTEILQARRKEKEAKKTTEKPPKYIVVKESC